MGDDPGAIVRSRGVGGELMSAVGTADGLKIARWMVDALDTEKRTLDAFVKRYPDTSSAPAKYQREVPGWLASAAVVGMWREHGRQALFLHPGLVESIRMSSSSKITPEVFRTLPYMEPLVVFPEPFTLRSHTRTETAKMLGFFTYGKDASGRQTSTHDPDATVFGAYVLLDITPEGSPEPIIECDAISFPMTGEPYTLSQAVDRVEESFRWSVTADSGDMGRQFIRGLCTIVIGSVMYLCSTTLEAEQVPRKAVSKILGTPRAPFSAYRVGWTIGAALNAARKSVTVDDPSQQPKSGYEQEPQHRRAHFKTVWTGEGSMIPKTVFIAPYWTHVEKLGREGVNTARPVKL